MTKPPKILMAAHVAEASGAPKVLVDLAHGCRAAGWDVTVVMPGTCAFDDEIAAAGMSLHRIAHPMGQVPWWAPAQVPAALLKRRAYYREWRRFLQGRSFDMAYISASVEVLRGLACARANLPLCWHVHEDLPSPPPALLKRKLDIIKRHSRVIVYAAEACRKAFQPVPARVAEAILWNGIDLDKFAAPPGDDVRQSLRKEWGVGQDEWLICTAAFAQPRKGVDVAVEAMKILRDEMRGRLGRKIRWMIFGDWHEAYPEFRRDVEERIGRHRLEEDFRIAGFRRDLPQVFAAADLFVLPSRNEAMPLVLCEAMAAGLPVVSTATGDVRAMLNDGELGWVAPVENPRALAEAIANALSDESARRIRAAVARRRAFEKFSLDRMKSDFLTLMESHFLSRR